MGDGIARRARPGAVRRHLGHRHAARRAAAALLDQLAPGAALVCPVERGGRELLMRFRDGEEETVTGVRFVPLVTGEP